MASGMSLGVADSESGAISCGSSSYQKAEEYLNWPKDHTLTIWSGKAQRELLHGRIQFGIGDDMPRFQLMPIVDILSSISVIQ